MTSRGEFLSYFLPVLELIYNRTPLFEMHITCQLQRGALTKTLSTLGLQHMIIEQQKLHEVLISINLVNKII